MFKLFLNNLMLIIKENVKLIFRNQNYLK